MFMSRSLVIKTFCRFKSGLGTLFSKLHAQKGLPRRPLGYFCCSTSSGHKEKSPRRHTASPTSSSYNTSMFQGLRKVSPATAPPIVARPAMAPPIVAPPTVAPPTRQKSNAGHQQQWRLISLLCCCCCCCGNYSGALHNLTNRLLRFFSPCCCCCFFVCCYSAGMRTLVTV